MSILKSEQRRATTPVFRQFISFVIAAILVTQHLLIISPTTAKAAAVAPTELFFSEYIEGSSNNKALEIYNGTGSAIDLAAGSYTIQIYFNGAATATAISLTGTANNNDVFVLANSSSVAAILAQADQTSSSVSFNGDDAIVLRKGGATGQILDVIGQVGFDPGTEWGTGLISTADNTIRRKSSIETGDTNSTDVFDPSVQWDGFATDTFDGLGSHTFSGGGTPTSTNPSGSGSANPTSVLPGENTTLTVAVTPGTNPASNGITVTANLTAIGGSAAQSFSGSGNTFTFQATVAAGTTAGAKNLPFTVSDSEGRSTNTGSISLTVNSTVVVSDHVVISQVYGSGGNSGAAYRNDYVELYNPTGAAVSLTGWTLQYSSATGSGWDGSKQPLGGNIGAGEYYLVGLGTSNSSIGSPLPNANVSGELNLSGLAGKVALVGNGDSLSGNCPLSDPDVVDFVGYGTTADCSEGDIDAPAPSSSNAIFRKSNGSQDTNV
nr:lamin tail domain-containing protein [Pyrinomonadaceae bacterium]